jgi:hypothetical protein
VGLFTKKTKKPGEKSGIGRVIAQSAALAPVLIPVAIFIPVMKKALKDKGITPAKAPIDLVRQFHDEIVSKSKRTPKKGSFETTEHLAPVAAAGIAAIVKGILEYFKNLKDKKAKAQEQISKGQAPTEPLTPSEEKLLAGAETATDTAKQLAKEEAQFQIGKYVPYLIGAVAVFFVLKATKVL